MDDSVELSGSVERFIHPTGTLLEDAVHFIETAEPASAADIDRVAALLQRNFDEELRVNNDSDEDDAPFESLARIASRGRNSEGQIRTASTASEPLNNTGIEGECVVCGSTQSDGPLWQCPIRTGHICCHDCINQFSRARVEDGMSMIPCPCDFSDCAHEISEELLREILVGDTAEQYGTLKIMHGSSHAIQCPTCNKPAIGNPKHPDMECDSCSTRFCYHHGLDHGDRPCKVKGPKLTERVRNWRWRKWHTRKCRKCGFRIEKNGGCNHMTCRCGHEICWLCGGDYNRNGQRGHSTELFPGPSEYKYCCNDRKQWAKRVAATTAILTVGVAAIALAAAGYIIYGVGRGTLELVAAPPRAISRARARRRERQRRQQIHGSNCAHYYPVDSGESAPCMFCGLVKNGKDCIHAYPPVAHGSALPMCMFCNEPASRQQYEMQHGYSTPLFISEVPEQELRLLSRRSLIDVPITRRRLPLSNLSSDTDSESSWSSDLDDSAVMHVHTFSSSDNPKSTGRALDLTTGREQLAIDDVDSVVVHAGVAATSKRLSSSRLRRTRRTLSLGVDPPPPQTSLNFGQASKVLERKLQPIFSKHLAEEFSFNSKRSSRRSSDPGLHCTPTEASDQNDISWSGCAFEGCRCAAQLTVRRSSLSLN